MLEKIIEYLYEFLEPESLEIALKKYKKEQVIRQGLLCIIQSQLYTSEELRKEISLYTKRIISQSEWNQLLDVEAIKYSRLLNE